MLERVFIEEQKAQMFKHVLHAVVAVLLWIVFVYYWRIVFRQPMNPDTQTALISLALLTLVTTLGLTAWVFHNILIHRRVRTRRQRRREALGPTRDYLGRRIVMDDADRLRRSTHIQVDVVRGRYQDVIVEQKIFRPVE